MSDTEFLLSFFSSLEALIYSDDFRKRHRLNSAFFMRDRKLTFAGIILFLLRLPQKTLSMEMSDYVSDFLSNTDIQRISKQAFSKARQKISPLAFAEMLDFTYRYLRQFPSRNSNWHGYTLKAIDGTSFRVPNTPENKDYFQTQKNQHGEVALIKASCLYNMSAELMEKIVVGKCRDSEKAQALELLTHDAFHDESGVCPVIIFDRGYPSGELIHHIVQYKGIFLMRCSSATFKNVLACPQGDSTTVIVYNKQKIELRVLRFFLDSGAEEILITNLFDENLGINDFKELYFLRWGIEVKYSELKQQLKIENFASVKPICLLQEIYATLIFSNIVSVLKYVVDQEIKEDTKDKGNKNEYQANRNFLIGQLKKTFTDFLTKTQ